MGLKDRLGHRARVLKSDTYALYLAARHPDTPWYAKAIAAATVAYAFSPIDLIPDFVPVLGYVDDLLIVPLGISAAIRLVPEHVMAECRRKAAEVTTDRMTSRTAAAVVVAIWLCALVVAAALVRRLLT